MSVYLEDHPPARNQYRRRRRSPVTGAIVVHTAENTTDTDLPDGGAEAVAQFISRRTDAAGSYHSVVDSDSIVRVGKYEWEMFHEGTGGNRWSLGLSFACRAAQWPTLPEQWVAGVLRHGANEAEAMARWVYNTVGVVVPAQRITPSEYRSGRPGFISHAELDPGRRSDPGPDFPWRVFLRLYALRTDQQAGGFTMPTNPYAKEVNEALSLLQQHAGYGGEIDGWFGPQALEALHRLKNTSGGDVHPIVAALDARYERRDG